jgi:hypothetical protein
MTTNLTVKPDYMTELANTQQLCNMLMKTPHYAKMGPEGIFAVVETAKSLGVDPRQALGGGLYYVKGKVEMSSRMMNALIRSKKHSVTRDKKSDEKICILHGKRSDTGDTWTESFSMEDAARAGLLGNPVWKNYPKDMLFARALSRLARQLFPDIIGNCYVEGEILFDENINLPQESEIAQLPQIEAPLPAKGSGISEEQYRNLDFLLNQVPDYRQTIMEFAAKKGIHNLWEMPIEMYEKVVQKAQEKIDLDEGRI